MQTLEKPSSENKGRTSARVPANFIISVRWTDTAGVRRIREGRGLDLSGSGARIQMREPIPVGAVVSIESEQYNISGSGSVRHCTQDGAGYTIGILFGAEAASQVSVPPPPVVDYYAALQIGRNADQATVERVYGMLKSRLHPDASEVGDAERFRVLTDAYHVLVDRERRARYDAAYSRLESRPVELFWQREFMDSAYGEINRRLGILCLLYNRRRKRPDSPGLTLQHIETVMSLPREHLNFALWYLKEKKLVAQPEGPEIALTAQGVDHLESVLPGNPLVEQLLRT